MSPVLHFSARAIADLQERLASEWHRIIRPEEDPDQVCEEKALLSTIREQHRANFDLWHVEDRARAPRNTPEEMVEIKRAIDRFNQRRNDLAECCDVLLLEALHGSGLPHPAAELHSESPGLMIDRLSILALKIYHTREEIERASAPESHRQRNRERLALLTEQRDDLVSCLDRLWRQVLAGERRFKIYRQLKMYNDPALNPEIYGGRG